MPAISAISAQIQQLARNEGFDLCGIASVGPHEELAAFAAWIEAGHHGDMAYLAARNAQGQLKRADLANSAPWVRSVIVCALNYNSEAPYSTHAGSNREGWIARYALGERDYHDVLLPKLRKLETQITKLAPADPPFRSWCYVDTGPIVERVFAQHAGIGWIGKNSCILNQQIGSWLFLGVILTNLTLEPDLPATDHCGSCTRCLDACPTNAFLGPHQLDATKCISYLTIEKRGSIPEDLREAVGRHLFGCDICQDVCPWNRRAPIGATAEVQPKPERINPSLQELAAMDVDQYRDFVRKSPLKRTKWTGFRRNLAVAIGNSGDADLLPSAERLATDNDPVVAEHGRWAVGQLRKKL
jgi:epoxyqueuosine reductase